MLFRNPLRFAVRSLPLARRASLRYESKISDSSGPWRPDPTTETPALVEDGYVKNTLWTIDVFRRWFKFSVVGLIAMGAATMTAYEGVHMWVEHVELAANQDDEIRRFEWDREAEKWSGGEDGGTDPALGWRGRHAVRSAWIAQNWGTGAGAPFVRQDTVDSREPERSSSLNAVDAHLEHANDFINTALLVAEERMPSDLLHPHTLVNLLTRHAGVLERIGSRNALLESRSQYERAWAGLSGKGISSARIAMKLGDLNYRLGDTEDALAWWARTMHLMQCNINFQHAPTSPAIPASPPSPLAQRTLASVLVSLSAFYATSGQLIQARTIQDMSLNLFRSISTPESSASASAPEALHFLYLLHRSSLISIHHAEVLFALRQPIELSMQWLRDAAQSSERVVVALTAEQLPSFDATNPAFPSQSSSPKSLLPSYSKPRILRKPALNLLQNARRSAAEAWNLQGVLGEKHGSDPKEVLYCYERALGWAGIGNNDPVNPGEPGEGVTEAEWKVFQANFNRARQAATNERRRI